MGEEKWDVSGGFRSSGMQHCVGRVLPDILRECSIFYLPMFKQSKKSLAGILTNLCSTKHY